MLANRNHIRALGLGAALTLAVFGMSRAATIHVPGDAPTIQAGLNAAAAGDLVLVAAGTYYEHDVQLAPSVTLASVSGAAATVIDAQESGHGLVGANGAVVRGFTVRGTSGAENHGLACGYLGPIEVAHCLFTDNQFGMVFAMSTGVNVHDCEIQGASTGWTSGIICENSSGEFVGNLITVPDLGNALEVIFAGVAERQAVQANGNTIRGGIFFATHFYATIEFSENLIDLRTSSLEVYGTAGVTTLQGNTILHGNGVHLVDAHADVTGNIIAFASIGISKQGGSGVVDCNDLWENGLNYDGLEPGPGDFDADPQFCTPESGDYHLLETSPCLPGHHPAGADCGLIGAYDAGCGATPVRVTTWGAIKASFR